eukprot:SAG22_NODE_1526_length_4224_cov_3.171394_3_plen_95_part_00
MRIPFPRGWSLPRYAKYAKLRIEVWDDDRRSPDDLIARTYYQVGSSASHWPDRPADRPTDRPPVLPVICCKACPPSPLHSDWVLLREGERVATN